MDHLSLETLAGLLEDTPTPRQAEHLRECAVCRGELAALREQTEALGGLADLRPPRGEWEGIEARLVEEGVLGRPAPEAAARPSSALHTGANGPPAEVPPVAPPGTSMPENRDAIWSRAAAVVALLVAGAAMGAGGSMAAGWTGGEVRVASGSQGASAPAFSEEDVEWLAALDFDEAARDLTLDEAAELVRLTEEWYLASLVGYQERMRSEGGTAPPDPVGRFAAIEALMAAGRAAVREDPTDPFLNGLLVNMHAERELALRGLQARSVGDNWY